MTSDGSNTAKDRKRAAESAAKVILAKHPSVVAGSTPPIDCGLDAVSSTPVDIGARNISRGLSR